jgi:sphingolipid C9-methyltransferase
LIVIIPGYCTFQLGGGLWTFVLLAILTGLPILTGFWTIASRISPRKNDKVRYPGRPVQHYLNFLDENDRIKYSGKKRIPMETFHEMYFDGKVDFKGDALDMLEYRHDWASFRFTIGLFKFFLLGMMPEVIMHSRSQGKTYFAL